MDKKKFQEWLNGVADTYHFSVDTRAPSSSDETCDDALIAVRELRKSPQACGDCGRVCEHPPRHTYRRVEDPAGDFWAHRCLECSRYSDFHGRFTIPGKMTTAALRCYWNRARTSK